MKPIVISVKRQKTEIAVFVACFLIANGLNVYSIVKYGSSWTELYMVIGYVFVTACLLYAATAAIRLIAHGLSTILRNNK